MAKRKIIAVAAEDDRGLEAQVGAHFGKSSRFVVVDVEDHAITRVRVVKSPYAGKHEAGAIPRFIATFGAEVVVSRGMGQRAVGLFSSAGIEVAIGAVGTVRSAVEAYLRGELKPYALCGPDTVADSCPKRELDST